MFVQNDSELFGMIQSGLEWSWMIRNFHNHSPTHWPTEQSTESNKAIICWEFEPQHVPQHEPQHEPQSKRHNMIHMSPKRLSERPNRPCEPNWTMKSLNLHVAW